MPALFDVPGWSVPATTVSAQRQPKKRKRTASLEEQNLLCAAQANLDKLIDSLGGDDAEDSVKKKRKAALSKPASHPSRRDQHERARNSRARPYKQARNHPDKDASLSKKKKETEQATEPTSGHSTNAQESVGLTSFQQGLKKSLNGARFRMLNETLYKSSSAEAVKMIKQDPHIFEDYHIGFRRQVQSWPSNPVSYYIMELSTYPPRTVIADLGCGDAALAQALLPKNFVVLSFDLVSDGAYVTEADICSRVPLPGTEPQSTEPTQGKAQVVDVVVCALSLMSTNWPKCISEAWRILRPGGKLMIAEVASRIASVDRFTSLVDCIGFKLQHKDDHNSHFTLFQFKKVARAAVTEDGRSTLESRGRVLKPCEYKRR